MTHELVLIFDGVCNLCQSSVNFVIRHDKNGRFQFTSAQSQTGIALQKQHHLNALDSESMVLIKDGIAYTKSDAAIEIAKNLDGGWKVLAIIKIMPKAIRDWSYQKIAANRYNWFGKKDSCMVPSAAIRSRFLS